jgi:hypothetical protein
MIYIFWFHNWDPNLCFLCCGTYFCYQKFGRKEQTICFVLEHEMQGDLFIPELWTKVTTWVEEI